MRDSPRPFHEFHKLQSASDTFCELKTLLHIILDRSQIDGDTQKAAQGNAHLICLNFAFVLAKCTNVIINPSSLVSTSHPPTNQNSFRIRSIK